MDFLSFKSHRRRLISVVHSFVGIEQNKTALLERGYQMDDDYEGEDRDRVIVSFSCDKPKM